MHSCPLSIISVCVCFLSPFVQVLCFLLLVPLPSLTKVYFIYIYFIICIVCSYIGLSWCFFENFLCCFFHGFSNCQWIQCLLIDMTSYITPVWIFPVLLPPRFRIVTFCHGEFSVILYCMEVLRFYFKVFMAMLLIEADWGGWGFCVSRVAWVWLITVAFFIIA